MIRKVAFTYEDQDIKVCPRCGEDEDISIDSAYGIGSEVKCDECRYIMQTKSPEDVTIRKWNKGGMQKK